MQERYPRFDNFRPEKNTAELYAPFVNGEMICHEINIYTYWQGLGYAQRTPKIKILFVAQDCGSLFDDSDATKNGLSRLKKMNRGDRNVPYIDANCNSSTTDENLFKLFKILGYDLNRRYDELFFTNFCLGYRRESSVGMTKDWMLRDADLFKKLCEILEPENILCMGKRTFECVYQSLTGEPCDVKNFNDFLDTHDEIILRINGDAVKIYPLSHCGTFGLENRIKNFSPLNPHFRDWNNVKKSVGNLNSETIDDALADKDNSFAEFLFTLIDGKQLTAPEVYKKANIVRKTFTDIRKGTNPEKDTVLKIIFAMKLSIIDAVELLRRAGYALSPSNDSDLLVTFFISQRNFDVAALEKELVKRGLPRIFSNSALYDYLMELLEGRKLKRADFCKAVNLPAEFLTEIRKGKIPDKEVLSKIISVLKLTSDEKDYLFKVVADS